MKYILLIIGSIFYFSASHAQSFQYRKYVFEWAPGRPDPIAVEQQFMNEDAVILDEKVIYNVSGNRVPSYAYLTRRGNYFYIDESAHSGGPIIQKHVRIKFLTSQGIKKHSTIVLPESFDPPSDRNSIRPENRDSIFRPKGEFECIRYFAARIIRADGKITAAILDEKTQLEIDRHNQTNSKLYSWIFRIINLEPGDELELDYSYEKVFSVDPSSRIFFNSDLPKQNFAMTFKYPFEYYYTLTYANGATPDDSVMETASRPKYTEYHFTKKNLQGGIREVGARPYTQLPYITFYENKRDFGIMDPKTKFITRPYPYPWSFVLLPMVDYRYDNLNMRLSRLDHSTRTMNEFVIQEKAKVPDTSLAVIISSIQHTLAEEFEYQPDREYYEGDHAEMEHLGKYVDNKVLREISRHRIYDEIFKRLDRDYYSALFCDKRIDMIDMNEYRNCPSLRIGYAIRHDQSNIYLYPKSYRYGYEANELPFYYEDIQTILVPQNEPVDKKYEGLPQVNFTFAKTPFSGVKDNIRITSGLAQVSLDSSSIQLSARVKLSGQFSTIIRGYYQNSERDTTVNPLYYYTIASLADDVKHLKVDVTSKSKKFPYEASVSVTLTNTTSITKSTDGNYILSLDGWFTNIIDEEFSAENRHLNYYPDFQFQDTHKYMIKFDKKIQLLNAEDFQKNISNGFADYTITVTQTGDESLMVETNYIVKPEYAPSNYAKDVAAVFDAIMKMDHSSLKIKVM